MLSQSQETGSQRMLQEHEIKTEEGTAASAPTDAEMTRSNVPEVQNRPSTRSTAGLMAMIDQLHSRQVQKRSRLHPVADRLGRLEEMKNARKRASDGTLVNTHLLLVIRNMMAAEANAFRTSHDDSDDDIQIIESDNMGLRAQSQPKTLLPIVINLEDEPVPPAPNTNVTTVSAFASVIEPVDIEATVSCRAERRSAELPTSTAIIYGASSSVCSSPVEPLLIIDDDDDDDPDELQGQLEVDHPIDQPDQSEQVQDMDTTPSPVSAPVPQVPQFMRELKMEVPQTVEVSVNTPAPVVVAVPQRKSTRVFSTTRTGLSTSRMRKGLCQYCLNHREKFSACLTHTKNCSRRTLEHIKDCEPCKRIVGKGNSKQKRRLVKELRSLPRREEILMTKQLDRLTPEMRVHYENLRTLFPGRSATDQHMCIIKELLVMAREKYSIRQRQEASTAAASNVTVSSFVSTSSAVVPAPIAF